MANISDKAQISDQLNVEVVPDVALVWPCPACGSPSKEDHEEDWRICSKPSCRNRFDASEETPLEVAPDGPAHPCPACGKETKEDHRPKGFSKTAPSPRVCSNKACRHTIS